MFNYTKCLNTNAKVTLDVGWLGSSCTHKGIVFWHNVNAFNYVWEVESFEEISPMFYSADHS